jgi:hypoxanthine phosphoribosyltransferase
LHASRYREDNTAGELIWHAYPKQDLNGRAILIVDDIYDEGTTLGAIVDHCTEMGAGEIHIAVLVDKQLFERLLPNWKYPDENR